MEILPYKDFKLHGDYVSYYEDGTLRQKSHYENGLREGLDEFYYENGSLQERCFYKNDKLHGTFEAYNEDGTIFEKYNYKNGEIVKK